MNYPAIRKSHRGANDDIETSGQPKSGRRARCAFQILCLPFLSPSTRRTPYFSPTTPSYSQHSTTSQPQFHPNLQKSTTLTTSRSACATFHLLSAVCAQQSLTGNSSAATLPSGVRNSASRSGKAFEKDLRNFPVEKARLEVAFPACYISASLVWWTTWQLPLTGNRIVPDYH